MSTTFDYKPIKFLRTHSKNKDNADVQTQVWQCGIEPDGKSSFKGAHVVATCGGNSICFIDVFTGTVLGKYYTKDPSTSLFSLAWTSIQDDQAGRRNILAAGGSKSTIIIIDTVLKECVVNWNFESKRSVIINALLFHPIEKRIVFCGSSDGYIRICELAVSSDLIYDIYEKRVISTKAEIFDFTFCVTSKILLSSTNSGLHTIYFPTRESLTSTKDFGKAKLCVGGTGKSTTFGELVDSIEVLCDGLIAIKYALHGSIYICDLTPLKTVFQANKEDFDSLDIEPLYVLKWSDSDNYFMYMGVSMESQLLACGDDRGSIWLYDLSKILKRRGEKMIPPVAIIPWPNVTDHYNDKKRKLDLETYDIVLDKVVIHSSGSYIVAVTNNNLVCLWKKV